MIAIKQFCITIFFSRVFAIEKCKYEACTQTIEGVTKTLQHSACLTTKDAYCPRRLESVKLSDMCIDRMVQLHNECRQKAANGTWSEYLGPGIVTDMKPMKWNPKIAEVAQGWANQCKYEHDKCRGFPTADDWCGQNIYMLSRKEEYMNCSEVFTRAMKSWCDNEVVLLKPNIVKNFKFDAKYAHFTQAVWNHDETIEVGCGYSKFYQDEMKRDAILIVCNYCPGGNIRNEKMFSQEQIKYIPKVEKIVLHVVK